MNPQLEGKLSELGKILAEQGPGFLKFVVSVLMLFPRHTDAWRLGDKLDDVILHLP